MPLKDRVKFVVKPICDILVSYWSKFSDALS